ncbi:unnamed protein product, partial [marine sediment metagenome]
MPRKRYDVKRYHKDCGGEIINRKCLKCGKTWGWVRYYLAGDIEEVPVLKRGVRYGKRGRFGEDNRGDYSGLDG